MPGGPFNYLDIFIKCPFGCDYTVFLTFASMVYDLPVDEEKVKPHQVTTLHLVCSMAFIAAGAIIFRYNFVITTWGLVLLLTGVLLLVLTIAKNKWMLGNRVNPVVRMAELAIALWMAIYSLTQQWKFPAGIFGVLSAVIIFALYWERNRGSKLIVRIDDEGVKLPLTSRKRFLPWTELEQVVLRFGTLSIDCVDNHLFQWNIPGLEVDAERFDDFCKAKVEENRSKRKNNDW